MNKVYCLCCGYKTLSARGDYDICPVCFWEDELFMDTNALESDAPEIVLLYDKLAFENILQVRSGANKGLTLLEARENYKQFSACDRDMIRNVRPPNDNEKPQILPNEF